MARSVSLGSFFESRDGLPVLSRVVRAGADVAEAKLAQDFAHSAFVINHAEALGDQTLQVDPVRQRTTPCTARSGPVSTKRANSAC